MIQITINKQEDYSNLVASWVELETILQTYKYQGQESAIPHLKELTKTIDRSITKMSKVKSEWVKIKSNYRAEIQAEIEKAMK
ncbi:MAG: hypothetical protein M9892_07540 [Bacteroidetes bacterium]|nr:hypothetical protein [Bacteroidota bacterium]